MKPHLRWCPQCRENSLVVKVYKEGERVEYCINKGCGLRRDLPSIVSLPEDAGRNEKDLHPVHPDSVGGRSGRN